jgi:FAD/FMN-containing dehydrogenase
MRAAATTWVALLLLGGCGASVEALDPRDLTLPPETRRFVADAEDGLIVARSRRDAAALELSEVEAWRDRLLGDVEWSQAGGVDMDEQLETLMGARVELARLELAHIDALVELAEAKYDLANAERAVLHDLATYDLDPLRARVAEVRELVEKARDATRGQRQRVEEKTTEFWRAYARYVEAGGDTRSYWTAAWIRVERSLSE